MRATASRVIESHFETSPPVVAKDTTDPIGGEELESLAKEFLSASKEVIVRLEKLLGK